MRLKQFHTVLFQFYFTMCNGLKTGLIYIDYIVATVTDTVAIVFDTIERLYQCRKRTGRGWGVGCRSV